MCPSLYQWHRRWNMNVFLYALPHYPFQHCLVTTDNSPESFIDAFIVFVLNPPSPSLATIIRRPSTRHHSSAWEPTKIGSDDTSTTTPKTNLRSDRNLKTPKENVDSLEKCDSKLKKLPLSTSPSIATEEGGEEPLAPLRNLPPCVFFGLFRSN